MRKSHLSLFMALAITTIITFWTGTGMAESFTLTSPTIADGTFLSQKHILNGFGCMGDNTSPALEWANPPEGTKSFALTVYDPDAPTGSGWWHWVVFNIPSSSTSIINGAGNNKSLLPAGATESRTDFGSPGYGGACPPEGHGDHRYHFTLHALNVEKIDLPADSSAAMVGFYINAHSLGKATITAHYNR